MKFTEISRSTEKRLKVPDKWGDFPEKAVKLTDISEVPKNCEKVTDIRGTCADIPRIIQNPAESNVKNPKTAK